MRRWLALIPLLFAAPLPAAEDESVGRMKKDLAFLTSEECEGRGVRTEGINKAADHVAKQFEKAGLLPAPGDAGYLQPFTIGETYPLAEGNAVSFAGPADAKVEAKAGEQFAVTGMSGKGKASAGSCSPATASRPRLNYDDYAGIDAKGKVVVHPAADPPAGPRRTTASTPPYAEEVQQPVSVARRRRSTARSSTRRRPSSSSTTPATAGKDDPLMSFDYARGGRHRARRPPRLPPEAARSLDQFLRPRRQEDDRRGRRGDRQGRQAAVFECSRAGRRRPR